jgi:hypothetical protein
MKWLGVALMVGSVIVGAIWYHNTHLIIVCGILWATGFVILVVPKGK